MSRPVGLFTAAPDVIIELGSFTPGGLTYFRNMGPNPVWIGSTSGTVPPNEGTVSPGDEPDYGIPLSVGESLRVQVPVYPVSLGTIVPVVVGISTGSMIAYSVEGS